MEIFKYFPRRVVERRAAVSGRMAGGGEEERRDVRAAAVSSRLPLAVSTQRSAQLAPYTVSSVDCPGCEQWCAVCQTLS